MKYSVDLEVAISVASSVSRYLEDQRVGGEEWTTSVWLRDGKFTVWFQIECRVRSSQGDLRKTSSKLVNPALTLEFAYVEIDTAFRELRG